MNQQFGARATAIALIAMAVVEAVVLPRPVAAQSAGGGLAQSESQRLAEQIKAVEEQIALEQQETNELKRKKEPGFSEADFARLDAALNRRKSEAKNLRARLALVRQGETFARPVDLRLSDASVRQAAQALAQASGLTITVDKAVSDQTRLSVEARRVPLANVLETVARQANLLIAPAPNGVLLTTVPTLKVNGPGGVQSETFGSFPWSDAWGIPPTANLGSLSGGLGGGGFGGGGGGFGGGGGGFGGPEVPAGDSPHPFFPALPDRPLMVTPIGDDLLVVAERGYGPNSTPVPGSNFALQETGIRFTTYRLDKTTGKLTRLSSTFFGGGEGKPPAQTPAPKSGPAAAPASGR